MEAAKRGYYVCEDGSKVDWQNLVKAGRTAKVSIPPDTPLPQTEAATFSVTRMQVTNETTLGAARRLVEAGQKPAALNFANGIQPCGGFLSGARHKRRCFAAPALYTKHWLMTLCIRLTASAHDLTRPHGQFTPQMFLCFGPTMAQPWSSPGF